LSESAQRSRSPLAWQWFNTLLIALLALAFAFPVYFMVSSAFKAENEILAIPIHWVPHEFAWFGEFQRAMEIARLDRYVWNSALLSFVNVVCTLLFSAMAGYGFAKFDLPFKNFLFFFVISTMMIPQQILVVPLFVEIKYFGWVNTYGGLIIPGLMNAFGVFMMRQFIAEVPTEIIEAGRADGASEIQIFLILVLPLLLPALASLAIIIFIWSWGNFLWPLVAVSDEKLVVLATGITNYTQPYQRAPMWGAAMAAATIATLPVLIVFIAFQRHFVKGITAAAIKG
jgi:ABC-type glycerol-3-phosphate transport system permease component